MKIWGWVFGKDSCFLKTCILRLEKWTALSSDFRRAGDASKARWLLVNQVPEPPRLRAERRGSSWGLWAAVVPSRETLFPQPEIQVQMPGSAGLSREQLKFLQLIFMEKVLICSFKDPLRSIIKLRYLKLETMSKGTLVPEGLDFYMLLNFWFLETKARNTSLFPPSLGCRCWPICEVQVGLSQPEKQVASMGLGGNSDICCCLCPCHMEAWNSVDWNPLREGRGTTVTLVCHQPSLWFWRLIFIDAGMRPFSVVSFHLHQVMLMVAF